MKTNPSYSHFNLKKKYNKAAYYTILIVTLHWSFVSPAQVIFEAYFDIHGINSQSILGLFSEDPQNTFVATFENIGENERVWDKEIPDNALHFENRETETLKKDTQKKQSDAVVAKKDIDLKESAYRSYPADLEEGVIGVSKATPFDSPSDNLFKVTMESLPTPDEKVYLVYELFGVQDHNAVSRSINDRSSVGGYSVKRNTEWTIQKEEINPKLLKEGENKILFTIPDGANHQYTIKNLRIETERQNTGQIGSLLVIHDNLNVVGKDGSLYVKGFVKGTISGDLKVIAGNTYLRQTTGNEFEGFVKINEENQNNRYLAVKAMDDTGLLGQEILTLDVLHEADRIYPMEMTSVSSSKSFRAYENNMLAIYGASIKVGDSALTTQKEISITQLRKIDIAPMESGMVNVTRGGNAYRFLPDGTTFEEPVKINIAYDSLLIPKGYSSKDIRTFYFNTNTKKWMVVPRDSIDHKNKVVTSLTTHFTDYVNGIIQSPESPETGAFLPTMMNDLQAANPSAEMTIISPPQASQKGGANVGYPIKIPAGRNGMQPQLAIQYDNEGGNGWLGLGWNLNVPAVTLDTRWGVPLFDSENETEIYTIAGEQLMYPEDYLPHRHEGDIAGNYSTDLQSRGAHTVGNKKVFTPRKQGSFVKIERIGINTTQYRWKVTNTNGTVSWYGGDESQVNENAVIRNSIGNIVHWGLVMTEDVFGNNVKYTYTNTNLGTLGGQYQNLSNGKVFYPKKIIYTGYNGNDGNYTVEFETSTSIKTDVTINGRLGLKQVDPYLLEHIYVKYQDNLIRSYDLNYNVGRFNKQLLISITENDKDGIEFYSHDFEYYDDIESNNGKLYKAPVTVELPDEEPSYAMNFGDFLSNSGINTSETIETGFNARISVGFEIRPGTHSQNKGRWITIGAPFGENSTKNKGKITLADMDGDGLDDFVFRKNSGLKYVPNGLNANLINEFDTEVRNINDAYDFSKSKSFTKTMFGESYDVYAFGFSAATHRTKSKTETEVYFMDGNGDGLLDIVRNEVVYFNKMDELSGEPTFITNSEETENLVIRAGSGVSNWEEPDPIESEPEEATLMDFDVVMVWTAPRDGVIQFNDAIITEAGSAYFSIETTHSGINSGIPFRVILGDAHSGIILYNIDSYNNGVPLGTNYNGDMIVEKGQKIYFRGHNNTSGMNPEFGAYKLGVFYVDTDKFSNENGILNHRTYADIYQISSNEETVLPGTGDAWIEWDSFTVQNHSDDVYLRVYRTETIEGNDEPNEQLIYEKYCEQGASTVVNTSNNDLSNPPYPLSQVGNSNDEKYVSFRFEVFSDTNVKWNGINWAPSIIYEPDDDAVNDQYVPDEIHTFYPVPKYSIFHQMNTTPEYYFSLNETVFPTAPTPSNTNPVLARPKTTITNTGHLTANDNGEFLFVVKKRETDTGVAQTVGKTLMSIDNGVISLNPTTPITVFDTAGALNNLVEDVNLFFGFYADGEENREILEKYLAAVGQQESVQISYSNFVFQNSTTSTSAIEYYNNNDHLGPQHFNWGQFFYNENYDDDPSIPSDGFGKLINNAIVENPNLDYNIDLFSNCPQDEDFLDCVMGSLNLPADDFDFGSGTNLEDFFDNLEDWMNDEGFLDNGTFVFPEITFLPGRAFRSSQSIINDSWVGFTNNMYLKAHKMKTENIAFGGGGSGGAGGGDTGPFAGEIEDEDEEGNWASMHPITGMEALTRVYRNSSRSYSAGYGPAVISKSKTGYSHNLTDFIDLNGDRYPDLLYPEDLVKTNMTGGLQDSSSHNFGVGNTFENENFGLSLSGNTNMIGKTSDGKKSKFDISPASARIGLNVNLGGENTEENYFMDLNGDGLPDRIVFDDSFQYKLNLGQSGFSTIFEPFLYLNSNVSKPRAISTNLGGGLGFGQFFDDDELFGWAFSFSAGFSASGSNTKHAFQDINGDGLVDLIITNSNGEGVVRFNDGNGFSNPPTPLSVNNPFIQQSANLNGDSRSRSVAASAEGSGFFGFPVCCYLLPLVHVKFGATLGGNLGITLADTEKTFKDFDGDGYADFIVNSNGNLQVYYSAIGRTNMLKTVNNPLGGSFTMDYKPNKKTYNNPNAKWVMSDLYVDDGYDLANDGEDIYHQQFVYENAKYDRREREFYGFEKVKTIEYIEDNIVTLPPTLVPYRTSVSIYHNNSYFLNGLLKESYVVKGSDDSGLGGGTFSSNFFSRTLNSYTIYGLQENNTEIDLSNILPEDYDVGGTEGRGTAAVFLTETENRLHELSSTPLVTKTALEYDALGRVVKFIHHGDVSTPSDDYTSEINYHDDVALLDLNIRAVPEEIMVKVGTDVVRKRSTGNIDLTTGTIGSVIAEIDAQNNAVTTLDYDQYGNLSKVTYPENDASEAMFYEYTYDPVENKYAIGIEDAFGYASSSIYNYRFDTLLETEDLAGNKMNYEYDDFGRVTKITAPKEQNGLIGDYTVKYAYYTAHSQLTGVANINEQDFMPVAVTSHYDEQHPNNAIETLTFIDGLSRPVQVKKDIAVPLALIVPVQVAERMSISGKTAFDRFGRSVKQYHPWHEDKDPDSNYKINNTVNTPNSYYSSTFYDEIDRPIKTIDPEGNEAIMEYALDGGLHKTITTVDQNAQNQIITKTFKDALGRVVETLNVGGAGDISTVFEYNPIGELLSYTDDEGLTTSYTYDLLGRKSETDHPDSGRTKYFYDNASNLIQLQTEKLIQTQEFINYIYEFNRLTDIVYPGTNNISNASYVYGDATAGNNAGRLITQIDATGEQEFEYGNMGELIYTKRTVVGPNIPTRSFETSFSYDSWNRLLGMVYPDGEEVDYSYDLGGNLTKLTGEVNSQPYDYVAEIRYDYFEMPVYMEYGNSTKTHYNYTPQLRRLNTLKVQAANNDNMFNNSYSYDKVGNITGIINNEIPNSDNQMGGTFQHSYVYDVLNRLTQASGSFSGNGFVHPEYQSSYNLRMGYNSTHGITRKRQTHNKNNSVFAENTYVNDYTYHQGTHRVASILNTSNNVEETFSYDDNGNMTSRQINSQVQANYYWDENNRLRVVDNELMMHHYIYDAGGQRILKSSSDPTQVYENGTPVNPSMVQFDNYLTYPSAFLVIKGNGEYSKHYFNGGQRIAARIGEEDDDYFDLGEPLIKWETIKQLQIQDLQGIASQAERGTVSFKPLPDTSAKDKNKETGQDSEETSRQDMQPLSDDLKQSTGNLYFYHPDHLGTGTFLTDANGLPYQFFLNLPFGETMIEQHSLTEDYENLWKFTGHELDKETGMYYAGARYYNPKWSIWLSVDPLAEQAPGWTPYRYGFNNPVRYTDPTGLFEEDHEYSIDNKGYIKKEKHIEGSTTDTLHTKENWDCGITNEGIEIKDMTLLAELSNPLGDFGGNTPWGPREGTYGNVNNKDDFMNFFVFASDNTKVEWAGLEYKNNGFLLGTYHDENTVGSLTNVSKHSIFSLLAYYHSHPGNSPADNVASGQDMEGAYRINIQFLRKYNFDESKLPSFYIYRPDEIKPHFFQYSHKNERFNVKYKN